MVEKAPHRKLKIEQHESRLNRGELGCTTKQILIKVLTAMTIMPPYGNILLYGIESFICSLCLNNEIIIEIKSLMIKLTLEF
jgi:hypothetical protein